MVVPSQDGTSVSLYRSVPGARPRLLAYGRCALIALAIMNRKNGANPELALAECRRQRSRIGDDSPICFNCQEELTDGERAEISKELPGNIREV
jgi:hypothetical protein